MGISYILVYRGAISILFLFILMLINVRISELLTDNKNSIPLGICTVLSFNYTVQGILPYCLYVFSLFSGFISKSSLFNNVIFLKLKIDSVYSAESSMEDLRIYAESYDIARVSSKL